ncbi:MAG TPA: hypothetical protein VLV48_01320 [Thermoanaerobaculia bacterium]|nr:hypothetical protein [Thermoanaerobaculia bacterium]
MSIERDLREALRRPEPPAGFADRVMERIAEQGSSAGTGFVTGRQIRAAAMVLLLLGAGGWGGYRYEQNRRAEEAAQDVIAALRLTSEKLNLAKDNLEMDAAE